MNVERLNELRKRCDDYGTEGRKGSFPNPDARVLARLIGQLIEAIIEDESSPKSEEAKND